MSAQTKTVLKTYFESGDRPTAAEFADLIDSFADAPVSAPATAGATGTAGQWAWDSGYIYICVATNTWKRAALSTWT